MSSAAPLRERPHTNTTSTDWQPSMTAPLQITKRDSPQPRHVDRNTVFTPTRRSSVKNLSLSNRVSNSPFLTQQRRRVSGEKRPRSSSMYDQAENENPAMRKRRQSQVSELLSTKKPVTNSSFKSKSSQQQSRQNPPPPQPPSPDTESESEDDLAPPPPPKELFGRASPHRGPSPARPSLVSRRLHGPRLSLRRHARRKTVTFDEKCDVLEFDVEEDENSNPFDWVTDDDDDLMNGDDHDRNAYRDDNAHHDINANDRSRHNLDEHEYNEVDRGPLRVHNPEADESFDSFQNEDSIAGLVDSMLQDSRPTTPPHDTQILPDGLETEDGVPYGRSHHADRHASTRHIQATEPSVPFPAQHSAPSTPAHSREGTPITSVSPGSHIPLGRSTHTERIMAQKEQGVEDDVTLLPASPSPAKRFTTLPSTNGNSESLVPRFSLDIPKGTPAPATPVDGADPFSYPQIKDIPRPQEMSPDLRDLDPGNLSIGNSEVSLSGIGFEIDIHEPISRRASTEESSVMPAMSTPPTSPPNSNHAFAFMHNNFSLDSLTGKSTPTKINGLGDRTGSPALNGNSPLALAGGSPAFAGRASGSPLVRPLLTVLPKTNSTTSLNSPNGSPSGRSPRITREGIQRKLEKKRSVESPLRELADPKFDRDAVASSHARAASAPHTQFQSQIPTPARRSLDTVPSTPASVVQRTKRPGPTRIPPPKLRREDNPTYDGIMFLDPEPQPIDPPRPDVAQRASSFDDVISGSDKAAASSLPRSFDNAVGSPMANLGDMRSALDRLMADVAGEATLTPDGKGVIGLKVEAVTEGVKAGRYTAPQSGSKSAEVEMADPPAGSADESREEEDENADDRMDVEEGNASVPMRIDIPTRRPESLLHTGFLSPEATGNPPMAPRAISPRPISPQPGNNIRAREELIKAMKARRREEEEEDAFFHENSVEYYTPPRRASVRSRPSNRRRSRSTGDAGDLLGRPGGGGRKRAETVSGGGLLDTVPIEDEEDPLADSIDRELMRLKGPAHAKYLVRERSETIYASSDMDKVSHLSSAGDLDTGKAWRTVRRPSDINEYSKQIKELHAQEPTKAHGKVFIKVVGIQGLDVPLPKQQTAVTLTLNNGIHFVTTPPVLLARDCRIDQEFEIIEHSKLEFTLTLKVPLDGHIKEQFRANAPAPRPPPTKIPSPPQSKGGINRFFGGNKKTSKSRAPVTPPAPPPPHKLPENLARYLMADGTLARLFISYKNIADRCDTKRFEFRGRLLGQKSELDVPPQPIQVGELVLQAFRLPPLPGLLPDQLPQSLEECHRGLKNINWHKTTHHDGTLTQYGGDCKTWRRRHMRATGACLVAFNDVTKRPTATIDLRKAVAVEDNEEARVTILSPDSGISTRSSRYVEHDGPYGMERSFRIVFKDGSDITFFADTDDEKAEWIDVLRTIIGDVPPNPLWAEMVWRQREERQLKSPSQSTQAQPTLSPIPASGSTPALRSPIPGPTRSRPDS